MKHNIGDKVVKLVGGVVYEIVTYLGIDEDGNVKFQDSQGNTYADFGLNFMTIEDAKKQVVAWIKHFTDTEHYLASH